MTRWLAFLVLALATGAGHAAMACRIVTAGSLSFGSYEVFDPAPKDSLLALTVTCDRSGGPADVTLTLRLGPGLHAATVNSRRLLRTEAPADSLVYGLYRDVGRSADWGVTDGVDTMSQTLSIPNKDSRSATFVIYGRIPAQQDVSAGNYGDSVQAMVVY